MFVLVKIVIFIKYVITKQLIQMPNKRLSIIAKPTHECNLRCKYCYLEDGAENGRMSEQILAQSIEKVSDYADDSHWIWHGGEPLLMGLDFFKIIKDIQDFYKKKDKKFYNGIQSNATLITSNFLDFVEQTKDFYMGTSLDGPEEINNQTRIYKNGNGSFQDAIKGINLLKKRKLGGGAICVINAFNLNFPVEIYHFFKLNNINLKFNPLIKSGLAEKNLLELNITPKQYGDFLLKLWNIYDKDVKREGRVVIDLDPFIDIIGNLQTKKPIGCNYSKSCRENFISIGPQGDIYPCGRFDGVKEFWMGNIKFNTIEKLLNSDVQCKLKQRSLENVSGCSKCNFGIICNSGCMHNAYCNGDIMGKDPYCSSYKKLFGELQSILDQEEILKGGEK